LPRNPEIFNITYLSLPLLSIQFLVSDLSFRPIR